MSRTGKGEGAEMAQREIAIIGGGIAGLTAALIARQIGHDTLVIDPLLGGGQLVNIDRVDNFPGLGEVKGFDLGPQVAGRVMESGADFDITSVSGLKRADDGFELTLDRGGSVTAATVIVAVGSSVRRAGVPGEEEFHGRGVSYCGVCDGPFFTGKTVVVAGGGDSAADEAVHLASLAERVQLVYPGTAMHAMASGRGRVAATRNIEVIAETRVTRIVGGAEGVTAAGVRHEGTGEERELPADGVFLYAGLEPNTAFLHGVVDMDEAGHIAVDERLDTSLPGVMAAGDIRRGSAKLLIAAAGDGASAAVRASQWLAGRAGR